MKTVAVIGAGRLGTSLGYALSRRGYAVKAVSARTVPDAEESRDIIGQGTAQIDNIQTAGCGDIVILSVPDDSIAGVVKELNASNLIWENKFIFHCSGLRPSSLLQVLADKGALTASVHPNQSFPGKSSDPNAFQGVYFALEGGEKALAVARVLVRNIGGRPFTIQKDDKPLYHAACSIASNFFVALLDTSVSLLKQCGLKEEVGRKILLPLVEGTLQNVKKFNASEALSGPIIRGDHKSVKSHMNALKKYPEIYRVYISLAAQALEIAARSKQIPEDRKKAIKTLLERG